MTVYMVFEPPRRGADPVKHAERIVFVRDRFTWSAFLFAPLWMLWHRLWLVLLGYLVVMTAGVARLRFARVRVGARAAILAPIALSVWVQAPRLRRRRLRRCRPS